MQQSTNNKQIAAHYAQIFAHHQSMNAKYLGTQHEPPAVLYAGNFGGWVTRGIGADAYLVFLPGDYNG